MATWLSWFRTALLSWLRPEDVRQSEAFRARQAKVVKAQKPTYDAYPDREPHKARMRLVVLVGPVMETVDLDGYSLHEVNLDAPRWRRELPVRIARARLKAAHRHDAYLKDKSERAWQRAVAKEEADKLRAGPR